MGSLWSRGADQVQEINTNDAQTYTYPPQSGSYFGGHFFMGGKKFDTVQPEAYLFGDNSDLNMLGPKPVNFPHHSPTGSEPVRALKCFVNIRKDTLRLIRISNPIKPEDVIQTSSESPNAEEQPQGDPLYNLEFTFDAECPCSITVYYNASEDMQNKVVTFTTKQKSDTVHYNIGCNQQFCVTSHIINPTILHLNDRPKHWDFTKIPIAIQVSAECQENLLHGHSHITYATFEKASDDSWTIKPIKQKQAINGVCYLIQEIYGIENKSKLPENETGDSSNDNELDDDDSAECVVCLSDMRDTLILPCKHLCLCSTCANQLRFQQSGCPICRQSFRALLQIRAIRRKVPAASSSGQSSSAVYEEIEQDDVQSVDTTVEATNDENSLPFQISIPSGFEVVPLISAINGPPSTSSTSLPATRDITRTSSVVSTTSSLSRTSKSKSKTTVNIESEVASTMGSSGDGDAERKRSQRKKKSVKKKSTNKSPPEEIPDEPTLSEQASKTQDEETDESTTISKRSEPQEQTSSLPLEHSESSKVFPIPCLVEEPAGTDKKAEQKNTSNAEDSLAAMGIDDVVVQPQIVGSTSPDAKVKDSKV